MTTDIRKIHIPVHRRIIAISDIHGHCRLLERLLDQIGFCEDDELFLVGDLVAKGPENLETLRFCMELDKRENVHVLMGNMEYWHLNLLQGDGPDGLERLREQIADQIKWFGSSFFADMLAELGTPFSPDMDIAAAAAAIRQGFPAELEFLRNRPIIIETEHLIFVHGGLHHQNLEELRNQNPHPFLKNDNFLSKGLRFDKYLIVGHWPVCNYREKCCHQPLVSREQKIASIDGGCGIKRDGQLNALLITDPAAFEYTVAYCDGLPVKTALEAQAESTDYISIRYGDHEVTILEQGDGESYVEHSSTGTRLWVPRELLWQENGAAGCEYSDYRLAVEPGDRLGVCMETASGCYVKKDGYCGWYQGKLR